MSVSNFVINYQKLRGVSLHFCNIELKMRKHLFFYSDKARNSLENYTSIVQGLTKCEFCPKNNGNHYNTLIDKAFEKLKTTNKNW